MPDLEIHLLRRVECIPGLGGHDIGGLTGRGHHGRHGSKVEHILCNGKIVPDIIGRIMNEYDIRVKTHCLGDIFVRILGGPSGRRRKPIRHSIIRGRAGIGQIVEGIEKTQALPIFFSQVDIGTVRDRSPEPGSSRRTNHGNFLLAEGEQWQGQYQRYS